MSAIARSTHEHIAGLRPSGMPFKIISGYSYPSLCGSLKFLEMDKHIIDDAPVLSTADESSASNISDSEEQMNSSSINDDCDCDQAIETKDLPLDGQVDAETVCEETTELCPVPVTKFVVKQTPHSPEHIVERHGMPADEAKDLVEEYAEHKKAKPK